MATIIDVCKAAGVSKATVSRVINGSPQVKEKTRIRVLDAMKSLGFQPNVLAQALATNTSNTIGLILPHFDSYYFGSILKQTAQTLQKSQKKLFVMESHNSEAGEIEALNTLALQRCDAIMIYSRYLSETQLVHYQEQTQRPLVVLNRSLSTQQLVSFSFDQYQLGSLAVEHLLQLGHRNIVCLTTPLNNQTGQLRLQAYRDHLAQHNIPVNEALIIEGKSTHIWGYSAVMQLLDQGQTFSAIFSCNDDMALGAIRALHERGLSVPQDISVMGIDNEPAAFYSIPSLSTVSLPIEQLTIDATNLAINMANKITSTPQHFEYFGALERRESTLPLS
ncbi:LacI family DNA-binding transcriptional regulator [Vibrio gazogenes]|uniref:Regulatory protein, lacI family n=1 Tax=Vibrio gazogenes DSM 21264 = NBRC 103151 TaxID=1123492 RepID=A0A1M5GX01_VIBGA|nr:LacI family DNA-binding transcriptional regulator [Vibrio gazogenes]USP15795.1 LacI family transcriptional regulator [Vibrio gazogenes]SHG08259.1 regulatory protein, lacI family [Vibrio gazogenes DSM 21264] [Vibrio gazogenes DSM 21264 = NBRC 103151]SJN56846.1 HTH-type transcriptional regulator AscG [Vibrio gazogenes]